MSAKYVLAALVILGMLVAACGPQSTIPGKPAPGLETQKPTPLPKKPAALATKPAPIPKTIDSQPTLPAPIPKTAGGPGFICAVRGYAGGGYDDFQFANLSELGVTFVQGHSALDWMSVEPTDDHWKWAWADQVMDSLAAHGLQLLPLVLTPKLEGLHWDAAIRRDDPRYAAEYEEYAYELTRRYHDHPAWAGMVGAWGGSSDVWGEHPFQQPEVQVPLLNAVFAGVKRADPLTAVIAFNMATSAATVEDWTEWHSRAFALDPQFDWFGVNTHGVPVTALPAAGALEGVSGLLNVRKFLDEHGYAGRPLFVSEGGYTYEPALEHIHAAQVVETFVVGRALGVDLRGWAYFASFGKTYASDEGYAGLLSSLDEHDPPQPRPAWQALHTLVQTVHFFDYEFSARLSGEYNQAGPPFVYLYTRPENPTSRLWVVFAPWGVTKQIQSQPVTIDISPARQATLLDLYGAATLLTATSDGTVSVTAGELPVYVIAGD